MLVLETLKQGPLVAYLCAIAVTPLALILLALGVERRPFDFSEHCRAFIVGDPFLAGVVPLGAIAWRTSGRRDMPVNQAWSWVIITASLLFGYWQLRQELATNRYSTQQVLAPSKLFHQFVVYPVFALLLIAATILIAESWADRPWITVVAVALFVLWAALLRYDSRHPRLCHPPFNWRLVRSHVEPWPDDSVTLAAYNNKVPHK